MSFANYSFFRLVTTGLRVKNSLDFWWWTHYYNQPVVDPLDACSIISEFIFQNFWRVELLHRPQTNAGLSLAENTYYQVDSNKMASSVVIICIYLLFMDPSDLIKSLTC